MHKKKNDDLTINDPETDLELQKVGLEETITGLEADLRCPLDTNLDEQAAQTSNQLLVKRLLEVERNALRDVNSQIEKMHQV